MGKALWFSLGALGLGSAALVLGTRRRQPPETPPGPDQPSGGRTPPWTPPLSPSTPPTGSQAGNYPEVYAPPADPPAGAHPEDYLVYGPPYSPPPPVVAPASPPPAQGPRGPQTDAEAAAGILRAYPQTGPGLAARIVQTARAVGAHPYDLANLVAFETGGTFSSTLENVGCKRQRGPNSGRCAVGLIQFMPATSAGLFGWAKEGKDAQGKPVYSETQKVAASRRMAGYTPLQQMEWVQKYLARAKQTYGPLDTPYKVFMAVFYPVAIRWRADDRFPPAVTAVNPGIETPRDYVTLNTRAARLPQSDTLA